MKIVSKAEMCHADEIALKDEISILRTLDHPNILKLYDAFHEPKYYYLVTELMRGGELFDRIMMKQSYNEKEARDVCKILFEAVTFFHQHSIAHRDLKPDNLLLMVSYLRKYLFCCIFLCFWILSHCHFVHYIVTFR